MMCLGLICVENQEHFSLQIKKLERKRVLYDLF